MSMNAVGYASATAWAEAHHLYKRCLAEGGVFEVENATLLAVRGEDRLRFLNGQLSNDVLALHPNVAKPACCLDAKGKLCAILNLRLWDDGQVLLDATSDFRTSLPERLERYIIADDVIIDDVSDQFVVLHLFGNLQEQRDLSKIGGRSARVSRIGVEGTDWIIPKAKYEEAAHILEAAPHPTALVLETLRVEFGVPKWGAELDETSLPPEAGLEAQMISYSKGCYIGQEVISRLRSIGHPSKRLSGFLVDLLGEAEFSPRKNDDLKITDEAGAVVGRLTSIVWSFALDRNIALGYLKWQTAGDVFKLPNDKSSFACKLTRHTLPFVSSQ